MENKIKVLDLFCGLGGFSAAFRERGHEVIGVDFVPPADVVADVLSLPLDYQPDVILGSPPCTEFTKWHLPWRKCENPSLALVNAFLGVVARMAPKFWVMENVAGLYRFWDRRPVMRVGSRYLWGEFPMFLADFASCQGKWRLPPSKDRSRIRSYIPYGLSLPLCKAVECSMA